SGPGATSFGMPTNTVRTETKNKKGTAVKINSIQGGKVTYFAERLALYTIVKDPVLSGNNLDIQRIKEPGWDAANGTVPTNGSWTFKYSINGWKEASTATLTADLTDFSVFASAQDILATFPSKKPNLPKLVVADLVLAISDLDEWDKFLWSNPRE